MRGYQSSMTRPSTRLMICLVTTIMDVFLSSQFVLLFLCACVRGLFFKRPV